MMAMMAMMMMTMMSTMKMMMMVMMMMARRKLTLAANTIICDGDPGHVFNEAPVTTWAAIPPTLSCGVAMQ